MHSSLRQDGCKIEVLGKTSIEKKTFSFGHCPNYLTPPPPMTPIWATWSSFFGSRNSRFESRFRTRNTICTTGCPKKKFIIEFLAIMSTRLPTSTSLSLLCCCAVLSSPLCALSSFKANHYILILTIIPCNLDCSS